MCTNIVTYKFRITLLEGFSLAFYLQFLQLPKEMSFTASSVFSVLSYFFNCSMAHEFVSPYIFSLSVLFSFPLPCFRMDEDDHVQLDEDNADTVESVLRTYTFPLEKVTDDDDELHLEP